ncbi:arrestin domain-containing protein 17-like isoform X2 [Cryptotermes secundus]|uniref:arrestin domain-containing protein 17-like isoform X2 n=1 Tax=Cryptotermes secundus TaxID=105785 RepID=UPI000CD7C13E|nr:arrestin domain-containing protein 17-like isoform X2 [Cryptotermes secundus]
MGLTDLQLIFDNPQRTYFGGQTVSGQLVVKIDAPEELYSIIVEFKGMASFVKIVGDETYRGYEKYFKNRVKVFGGHGKTEVLQSGEHYYQFSMILPNNLPSSFKGEFFHIVYTVKATLDRPWRFDHEVKAFFTVLSHLDLTLDPKNKEPVKIENSDYFCCFFCKSGPLTLATHIPSRGYVPGQSIPMTIEVDNASDVKVYEVACELQMVDLHLPCNLENHKKLYSLCQIKT